MPEPVAIAAGIGSLLTSAYTLSKALYQAFDCIIQAPMHIKLVSQDMKSFYSILSTLHEYLEEEDTATGVVHPATCRDIQEALPQCIHIFQKLGELLAEFLRNDATESVSRWRTVRYLWKKDEISQLREHLMAHKTTLNLAICSANLYVLTFRLRLARLLTLYSINTRASVTTSQSIAAELQELRSRLTDLLSEFKKAKDRYEERGVELSNLQASFSHYTDHQEHSQPATSVRTPGTASMALTVSTMSITPYTYYSLTSSILGAEGTRSDRDSTYHDFMSLLSNSTVGTTNTRSTYTTAKARIEVERSEGSVDTMLQHALTARRIHDPLSRQIFVKGLQLNKSIVVNLERMTTLDDLLRHLQDLTGVNPDVIRLTHGSRKLSWSLEDIPSNATVIATVTCASSEMLGDKAQALTMRYSQFMVQSCVKVHKMLHEDDGYRYFWKNDVLCDIADHYWRDECKICHELCWKAVDDEVMAQYKSPPRSMLHPESIIQSVQTRIKRTSIKSIFRYQGLDLYPRDQYEN
jgi:hypothetical protein